MVMFANSILVLASLSATLVHASPIIIGEPTRTIAAREPEATGPPEGQFINTCQASNYLTTIGNTWTNTVTISQQIRNSGPFYEIAKSATTKVWTSSSDKTGIQSGPISVSPVGSHKNGASSTDGLPAYFNSEFIYGSTSGDQNYFKSSWWGLSWNSEMKCLGSGAAHIGRGNTCKVADAGHSSVEKSGDGWRQYITTFTC